MSEKIVKYGFNPYGVQKYLNKETNKVFIKDLRQPSTLVKCISIFMYFNGLSYRTVGNMMGVSHTSVSNWVTKFTDVIVEHFELSNIQEISDIEIDELFTFLDKKKENHTS